MEVGISADTTLTWSIEVAHEGERASAMMHMHAGEWRLVVYSRAYDRALAQGRVHWTEALKRALLELEKMVKP